MVFRWSPCTNEIGDLLYVYRMRATLSYYYQVGEREEGGYREREGEREGGEGEREGEERGGRKRRGGGKRGRDREWGEEGREG